MRRKLVVLALAFAGVFAPPGAASGWADEITLQNGDRITGTIIRVSPETVDLNTEAAGTIHFKREAVRVMRSAGRVTLAGADGKEHQAFVVPSEDWAGWHESEQGLQAVLPVVLSKPVVAPIQLPRQKGPVVLGYLGSSTWALNKGSGPVPALIDQRLRTDFPGVALTTTNGAVSGARVRDYQPGKPDAAALKTKMQEKNGFKVLRLMIGSNDAAAGMPTAQWVAGMTTIINDAFTWPVDLIILEEIGVRTDKGDDGIKLVREYNAARAQLAGPKVLLGTGHTLQNQSDHMDTLGSDHIHQTDAGHKLLAGVQAAEVAGLFAAGTATRPGEAGARAVMRVMPLLEFFP